MAHMRTSGGRGAGEGAVMVTLGAPPVSPVSLWAWPRQTRLSNRGSKRQERGSSSTVKILRKANVYCMFTSKKEPQLVKGASFDWKHAHSVR